jgi:hypothetical protein
MSEVRSQVVGGMRSPLGFFALALLIVEGFLLGAGAFFQLAPVWRLVAIGAGVLLFLFVFIAVLWLVVKHPMNLVFSEQSHLLLQKMYGDSARPLTGAALAEIPPVEPPEPPDGQLPAKPESP